MTHPADLSAAEWQIEWRESIGQRVMMSLRCAHDGEAFGPGAVCDACFATTQRIGALIEAQAAWAWEQGRLAERRDWEFTADLSTPDEERQPWTNPYKALPPVGGVA